MGGGDAVGGTPTQDLVDALRTAAARASAGVGHASVLYSGGLDSSLLAFLLKPHLNVTLVTVGTEGSTDVRQAASGARLLDLPWSSIRLEEVEIDKEAGAAHAEWPHLKEPQFSVAVALRLAVRSCETLDVFAGQGADELFFGYAHFRGLNPEEAIQRAQLDWQRLVTADWPMVRDAAQSLGHRLRSIYLDPGIVAAARRFPPPMGELGEPPKVWLRRAAKVAGLPSELVDRPKKAMQYGSGVERVVHRGASALLPSGERRS